MDFPNSGPNTGTVLTKLVFFSLMILILPITIYFAAKAYLFEGFFGMSSTDSYFYAAIVSICTVHVILAMYIYTAWTEDMKPTHKVD